MIAVIADDFTGAAEIGGIGLRHGLKVVIETEPTLTPQADLLVISADTRALVPQEAAQQIARITAHLMQMPISFIFKKLDSVLRGNILVELQAQMDVSGLSRAIIVAANPSFKRYIRKGIYYIDNVPLNETHFSADPQRPIRTASVLELLQTEEEVMVFNQKPDAPLPERGFVIADVAHQEDLSLWADKMDHRTLLAGASGFFDAILSRSYPPAKRYVHVNDGLILLGQKCLYVLGSAYSKDEYSLEQLEGNGYFHANMPKAIYDNPNFLPDVLEQWAEEVIRAFDKYNVVLVSVIHVRHQESGLENRLKEIMGQLVRKIVTRVRLDELLIEGGDTTSAILRHLGIKKLRPLQELDTGVIRMKTEKESVPFFLTTKPGSYQWPENIWIKQAVESNKLT